MTNAEYSQELEELAFRCVVLLRDCNCNKDDINDAVWNYLCEVYQKIKEYAE